MKDWMYDYQEKAENHLDLLNEEIIAIIDKLLEHKSISENNLIKL